MRKKLNDLSQFLYEYILIFRKKFIIYFREDGGQA